MKMVLLIVFFTVIKKQTQNCQKRWEMKRTHPKSLRANPPSWQKSSMEVTNDDFNELGQGLTNR